eukprot:s1267_g33.t1
MLCSALSLTPVAPSLQGPAAVEAMESESYVSMAMVFLTTLLCIAFGYIAVLRFQVKELQDRYIEQIPEETNALLRRRIRRLEREYDEASNTNGIDAMHNLSGLIDECAGLPIWVER